MCCLVFWKMVVTYRLWHIKIKCEYKYWYFELWGLKFTLCSGLYENNMFANITVCGYTILGCLTIHKCYMCNTGASINISILNCSLTRSWWRCVIGGFQLSWTLLGVHIWKVCMRSLMWWTIKVRRLWLKLACCKRLVLTYPCHRRPPAPPPGWSLSNCTGSLLFLFFSSSYLEHLWVLSMLVVWWSWILVWSL